MKTIEVFNDQGEARQLKLFLSAVAAAELTFILNSTRLLPPREKTKAVGQESASSGLRSWIVRRILN
ncbi:MAG: hypothetical protein ACYCOX_02865 [Acidobacteriaceae bacterium]